jgi:hypothetical protein
MDDTLPARLETMLLDLHERVLILEAGLKAPVPYVDQLAAEKALKRRRAPQEDALRRLEAYREAERAGAVDAFTRRLKAGEFDRATAEQAGPNGG